MVAIWKRELQNYFLTPIGYVFMGVFLLVGGVFFFLYNIVQQCLSCIIAGKIDYLLLPFPCAFETYSFKCIQKFFALPV